MTDQLRRLSELPDHHRCYVPDVGESETIHEGTTMS